MADATGSQRSVTASASRWQGSACQWLVTDARTWGEPARWTHVRLGDGVYGCGDGRGRGADDTAVTVLQLCPLVNRLGIWFFLGCQSHVGIPIVAGVYSIISSVDGASYEASYDSSTSTLILVGRFHPIFLYLPLRCSVVP
eukprot:353225-Chlamydomonas_euryale.AAC.7